jgi:hypothetical protein
MKKIIRQLWNESRWAIAVSLVWTVGVAFFSKERGFELAMKIATTFFASLFVVNWYFSQWNRVKKQQTVEEGLSDIKKQVTTMLSELEDRTKDLVGFITGGESICYLSATTMPDGNLRFVAVVHQGKHPAYGVVARIVDLEVAERYGLPISGESFAASETELVIGDLIPGHAKMMGGAIAPASGDIRRFNIFFTARNGSFIQRLRFRRVDGIWRRAIKVQSFNSHFEDVDDAYPRTPDGGVAWE